MQKSVGILLAIGLAACFTVGCKSPPQTFGELTSGYTYVPIDPFTVKLVADGNTNGTYHWLTCSNFLRALPDNTVRIAVETVDTSGNVSYGPPAVSVKGGRYKVTVDYINVDTANIRLYVAKLVTVKEPKTKIHRGLYYLFGVNLANPAKRWVPANGTLPYGTVRGTEQYFVHRVDVPSYTNTDMLRNLRDFAERVSAPMGVYTTTNIPTPEFGAEFNIPLYVGIGLRVVANVTSLESKLNIAGMGGIGAAAEAKKMSGSLVTQTLGVNGKDISSALPIQSELNQSSVQNAIVAVASIKTHLYDPDTLIMPRVVGLYLPFAGGKQLVSAIISELSKGPVNWNPAMPRVPVPGGGIPAVTIEAGARRPARPDPGQSPVSAKAGN